MESVLAYGDKLEMIVRKQLYNGASLGEPFTAATTRQSHASPMHEQFTQQT